MKDMKDSSSLPIHHSINSNTNSNSNGLFSPDFKRKKKNKLVFKNNIIKNIGLQKLNALIN